MLKSLNDAIRFLTVFKVGGFDDGTLDRLGQSCWAFPVVGAIIGFILIIAYHVVHSVLPSLMQAAVLVTLWIFLTGGLHIDGWVDCWDSLPAPVSPQDRLVIMKDSRIGTFGAVSLVSLLMLKVAALSSDGFPSLLLFLAPVAARTIMLFVAFRAPHKGEGMAAALIDAVSSRALLAASVIAAIVVLYCGLLGVSAAICAYAASIWFKRFAVKRLTVVTGDVIGATCELSECLIVAVGAIAL